MNSHVLPRLFAGLGLLLCCLFGQDVRAQDKRDWSAWQTVYDKGDVEVQISFALSTCNGKYLRGYSFYRTNTIVGRPFKGSLRGKIKTIDCEGKSGHESFTVFFDQPGIKDDMGQWFLSPRVVGVEDLQVSDYSRLNVKNKPTQDSQQDQDRRDTEAYNQQQREFKDKMAQQDREQQTQREAQEETDRQLNTQRQQYQSYINQGASYETSGNLSSARSQYQNALTAAPTESDKADARARIAAVDQAVAQKAENERQDRVTQKNADNSAAAQVLQQNQADETGMFIMLAAAPVALLFADLGENGPRSQYIKPSFRFSGHLGYSYQSYPIYLNDAEKVYNGSTTSTGLRTTAGQLNTPNIEGGGEFWPFYSGVFGVGAFVNGNFGYWFKQKNWGLEWGGKAFLGHPNVQLIGEYRIGYRHLAHEEQIAVNGGTSSAIQNFINAEADYNFRRIGAGLRINWNSSWGDQARAHVDLMYLQETFPTSEILTQKQIGYSAIFWMDDRLCFYANYFPSYARTGHVEGSSVQNNLTGSMLRVGFYRTLDVFGGKR